MDADSLFCAKCGAAAQDSDLTVIAPAPAYQPQPVPAHRPAQQSAAGVKMAVCLIAMLVSVILWFAAPFMAVNILTMGNQPTALQLVADDVILMGNIADTPAFWAAVVSIVGIAVCVISILAKKKAVTIIFAVLTEIVLVLAVVIMEYDPTETLGFGYVAIFILLLVALFLAPGRKKAAAVAVNQWQQAPQPASFGAQPAPYVPQAAPVAPQPVQAPLPSFSGPASNNFCAACARALSEEEWKCPACGAFRE